TILLVLIAVLVYLTYLVVSPFLAPLTWALALVIFAYPLHQRVQRRAAMATTLLLGIILVGPIMAITAGAAHQAFKQAQWFQEQWKLGHKPVLEWVEGKPMEAAAKYLPGNPDQGQLEGYLRGKLQALMGFVAAQAPRVMNFAATVLVNLFVVFLGTFYLFRDGPDALNLLKRVLPLDRNQQEKFFALVAGTIHASLFSSFVIAAVQGALGGLLFALLGLGHPVLWGVIMAFLSLIPMVGSALVWVPAAILLGVNGQWVKAGIMVAAGVLVIGTADNILRPILMKGRSEMSELLILISVIGGLAVFGMVGIVLGPLVVSVAVAALQMYAAVRAPSEP
ncbi:MAG: AI-2E family transporter, partial [Candidatus Acidiferrales bacterium]